LGKQVVLRSTGLFVADQKIADYNQIVEEVPRVDVENGVVFIGKARVRKGMTTSRKKLLAIGIPVLAVCVFTLFLWYLAR